MRIPTAVTGEAETAETATRGAGTRRTTVVTALTWALLLIGALLTPGPALAQRAEDSAAPLPPKLDVEAALAALETEQIYRAPGAVAYLDEKAHPRRTHRRHAGSRRAVHRSVRGGGPLRQFRGIPCTGVQAAAGLGRGQRPGPDQGRGPAGVVQQGCFGRGERSGRAAAAPWPIRRHELGVDAGAARQRLRHRRRTAPSHAGMGRSDPAADGRTGRAATADRVYNAPGREDPFQGSLDLIRESTGFTLRVVAFPPVEPGEPMVDYAPALAEHFPDDVILVAYGDWLEIAGPHPVALSSARNYAYGRYQQGPYRAGMVLDDRIGTVLSRADELLTQHPFGRPQPNGGTTHHRAGPVVARRLGPGPRGCPLGQGVRPPDTERADRTRGVPVREGTRFRRHRRTG